TALLFVSAVVLTGGLVRLARSAAAGLRPVPAASAALEEQRRRVDSGAAPRRPSRGKPSDRGGSRSAGVSRNPIPETRTPVPATVINVDLATAKDLEALPRIGPALAARIVAEREAKGPFGSLDSLQSRVKGIGPAMGRILAPLVTFGAR